MAEAPGFETTGGPPPTMNRSKAFTAFQIRPWWNTINPYPVEIGFEPLKSDTSVRAYTAKKGLVAILILYVNDLLLLEGDSELLNIEEDR